MKIYSFKDYLNNEEELKKLIMEFYEITFFLNDSYPNHKDWFSKQIIGCFNGERNILFTKDDEEVSGVVFLKNDKEESKICTLYVPPKYRGQHIATSLIDASFDFLGTTKPYMTVNKSKLNMFKNIIEKYDWIITDELENYYKDGETEVIFNNKK